MRSAKGARDCSESSISYVMASRRTIMATTSSCQPLSTTASWHPHHHQVVGVCNRSGTREFRCAKPFVFLVKWLSLVAEVGSLFLRFRGSIGESCWQKVHKTVARARFPLDNVKKLARSQHFGNMSPTKCVRDCSVSSISHKKSKRKRTCFERLFLAWSCSQGKMGTRLERELDFT